MTPTRLQLAAAVACTLASAPPAVAAPCRPVSLAVTLATPTTVELPPDGDLLVTSEAESSLSAPTDPATWRFVEGTRRTAPTMTTIAPGLVRLAAVGTRLEDADQATLVTFTRGTSPAPALAAPVVTSLEARAGRQFTGVIATLDAAPAEPMYLVVFDRTGKVPRSWGRASGTTVAVSGRYKCQPVPAGTIESRRGERVRLAWVDRFGRRSPLTEPLTIAYDTAAPSPY